MDFQPSKEEKEKTESLIALNSLDIYLKTSKKNILGDVRNHVTEAMRVGSELSSDYTFSQYSKLVVTGPGSH